MKTRQRFSPLLLAVLAMPATSQTTLLDQSAGCTIANGRAMSTRFTLTFNFGSGSNRINNTESADDFVVPADETWTINTVQAFGDINIVGEDVRIRVYENGNSLPTGSPVCDATVEAEPPVFNKGLLELTFGLRMDLPSACVLDEGRYWLSVQYVDVEPLANCGGDNCPPWYWANVDNGNGALQWAIRDPDSDIPEISCTSFGPATSCVSEPTRRDLCYSMEGSVINQVGPFVTQQLVQETVIAGSPVDLNYASLFTDPNGDPLTFSAAPSLPSSLQLDSLNADITGTVDSSLIGVDPVFSLIATDSTGRSGNDIASDGDLDVALRVEDANGVQLPDFASDVVVRCGGPASSSGTFSSSVDFSEPGDCGRYSGPNCEPIDETARVINAWVETHVDHPRVADLSLLLASPNGSVQPLLAQPGVSQNQACENAEINALFSDAARWPAQAQCANPVAILGELEPDVPLAGFRNLPAAGAQPWRLQINNAGNAEATLEGWCLALQVDRDGNQVFPQANLPGSAELVDLTNTDSATRSGMLNGTQEVDWYRVVQPSDAVRALEAEISTSSGLRVQAYRYLFDKDNGLNPDRAAGDCAAADLLLTRSLASFGQEYVRVQACGNQPVGSYTIDFRKVGESNFGSFPLEIGQVTGTVLDATTGTPILGAWLSGDGGSTFSGPTGDFDLAALAGPLELSVFHPDYRTAEIDPVTVTAGNSIAVPTVELVPFDYLAVPNQIVFENGFE